MSEDTLPENQLRKGLLRVIESQRFEIAITILIMANAVSLGLETSQTAMSMFGPIINIFDKVVLIVFALLPTTEAFTVMRALRILRVLRLISVVPTLRRVVGALVEALPGMASIMVLMGLFFYVSSVMATKLFSEQFPQWFGTIGGSGYTLFQVMTLESWSMGIVRPVMEAFPYAWLFFVPFILCTSFVVLNLFIGIIVSAMQAEHEEEANEGRAALQDQNAAILVELKAVRKELAEHRKNSSK